MSEPQPHFPYLTPHKAWAAFETFVLPGILNAMEQKSVNRPHLHVVALQPGVPYDPDAEKLPILFEHSVGNASEWEWPYEKYAYGKARITWRTGEPSRIIVLAKPHLLQPGDPRYWGSAILDGIIVGVSGVQPCFDEMFAMMTAAALRAEASFYAGLVDAMGDDASDFIPLPRIVVGAGHQSTRLRLRDTEPSSGK